MIGIVVHGPEVVDSGAALRLIHYLGKFGSVAAVLGGTMGRLAIIDAGLEDVISISPNRRPSETLRILQSSSDLLVLISQSKTRETGLAFGSKVAVNAKVTRPLIQIDCGGRFVAILAGDEKEALEEMARMMAEDLGLELMSVVPIQERKDGSIVREGNLVKRRLAGVLPGELITVNGIVIAKATDSSVEVEAQDGRVTRIKGAELKLHGIEKLPLLDLEKAIVRSGNIRRTEVNQRRTLKCEGNLAVLINHRAEDAFEIAKDACIAVTVGDDTTAIAGDILAHLSVPIIGVVDGDLDSLANNIVNNSADIANNINNASVQKGSIIIKLEPGYDDVIGRRIEKEIFKGEAKVQIKARDLANRIMEIAREHVVQIKRF